MFRYRIILPGMTSPFCDRSYMGSEYGTLAPSTTKYTLKQDRNVHGGRRAELGQNCSHICIWFTNILGVLLCRELIDTDVLFRNIFGASIMKLIELIGIAIYSATLRMYVNYIWQIWLWRYVAVREILFL